MNNDEIKARHEIDKHFLLNPVLLIDCPSKNEVWLEYGWVMQDGTRNMLWYNEGNPDEFHIWYRALMTKKTANTPDGGMYFTFRVQPNCDFDIVCK